jgi:hypothetical protein
MTRKERGYHHSFFNASTLYASAESTAESRATRTRSATTQLQHDKIGFPRNGARISTIASFSTRQLDRSCTLSPASFPWPYPPCLLKGHYVEHRPSPSPKPRTHLSMQRRARQELESFRMDQAMRHSKLMQTHILQSTTIEVA